jgi:hypothetical protein
VKDARQHCRVLVPDCDGVPFSPSRHERTNNTVSTSKQTVFNAQTDATGGNDEPNTKTKGSIGQIVGTTMPALLRVFYSYRPLAERERESDARVLLKNRIQIAHNSCVCFFFFLYRICRIKAFLFRTST